MNPPIRFADMVRISGLVTCCLCFDAKPHGQMWTDEDGDAWDICRECRDHEIEAEMRRARP